MSGTIRDITEFGAVGDGKTLNTKAVQETIDSLTEGGTVQVPPGEFLCGTIELKRNVTLYLMVGAVLRGSPDLADYREIGFFHNEMQETISLIYALSQENITIMGEGTIDLNGHHFMDVDTLVPMGVDPAGLTEEQVEESVVMFGDRPNQPIFFHNCKRVKICGIRVIDSPCWTVTWSDCRQVEAVGVTVENHPRFPNNDGFHLCATQDVIISGCKLYCGDDCIALTCITDWEGITRNVVISDCVLSSRSAALRLGHLASKIENVQIHHCTIFNTNRGLAIFAGDGGYVRQVLISDLMIQTHLYAGGWWGKGEPFVICAANSTGSISDITIHHIRAKSENPAVIAGTDGNVKEIDLSNLTLDVKPGKNNGLFPDFFDLEPNCRPRKPDGFCGGLYTIGVRNLKLDAIDA